MTEVGGRPKEGGGCESKWRRAKSRWRVGDLPTVMWERAERLRNQVAEGEEQGRVQGSGTEEREREEGGERAGEGEERAGEKRAGVCEREERAGEGEERACARERSGREREKSVREREKSGREREKSWRERGERAGEREREREREERAGERERRAGGRERRAGWRALFSLSLDSLSGKGTQRGIDQG